MFAETISRPLAPLSHHHLGLDDERLECNNTTEMQGFERERTVPDGMSLTCRLPVKHGVSCQERREASRAS